MPSFMLSGQHQVEVGYARHQDRFEPLVCRLRIRTVPCGIQSLQLLRRYKNIPCGIQSQRLLMKGVERFDRKLSIDCPFFTIDV